MVILLTGILENVRRQTQERLDAAFIGLDSRDRLAPERVQRTTRVGVGRLDGQRFGIVFTSRERDFRKNAAQSLNISLASVSEPVLVVTKKNKAVLQRLADWLRSRNAEADGRIDMPPLLIDDEADNASINTRKDVADTTAINKAIRDLLAVFTLSSYVGFTATPFANIFIDPTSSDDMLGDDLFPRDFIPVLEPPTNYVGMTSIFPVVEPDETEDATQSRILRSIDDEDVWLPATHKKDAVVEELCGARPPQGTQAGPVELDHLRLKAGFLEEDLHDLGHGMVGNSVLPGSWMIRMGITGSAKSSGYPVTDLLL